MAQKVQFLGFKRVFTGAAMQDNYLYFVRDAGESEGKIWFNGVCYGSCRDTEIDKVLEALEGFIPASGEVTNVKEYIDEAIAQLESDVTTIELGDGSFSGLTLAENSSTSGKLDYTLTLTNVAPKDEFDQEKIDRAEADKALQTELEATAQTLSDAIEAEEQAREAADNDLQEQIDELSGATDDLQAEVGRIETAVGLSADGNYVADDGQYVSAATSVLDATAKLNDALVQEVVDRNQAIEDAIEALIGDASESGNTLGELEDRIEELSADAKEYHLVKTTTGLPEEIKERYSLVDADGNVSGDTVDIPKDSHIVSITYITTSGDPHYQNLEYVYIDASGNTQTVYVDMSELVLESEFASGVTAIDGVVRGVVDPASETFLTVGAAGFKLSGVQDAIDAAVEAEEEARKEADSAITEDLQATAETLTRMIEDAKKAATTKVVEGTDAGNNMEIVPTTGIDSSVTYTINLTDVASASALTQEISDREAADAAIQAELNAVESSLGFTDTAYTNSGNYICGNTVTDDIKRLDTALNGVEDNFMEALEKEIEDRESGDTAIRESLEATAQALSDAIEEEAALRESGDTALDAKIDALSAATETAIEEEAALRESGDTALDARLDVVEEKYITGATVNGVDATVTDHVADVTINAGNIKLSEDVTGTTDGVSFDASANTQDVFQKIVDALNQSVAGSYTGVTSNDGSISLTPQTKGQDLSVNVKTLQPADVQAGETEVKKDESTGALYGVMYWIDEETPQNNG